MSDEIDTEKVEQVISSSDRKTFTAPLTTAERFYIFHDYLSNYSSLSNIANFKNLFKIDGWKFALDDDAKELPNEIYYSDESSYVADLIFTVDESYPYGWNVMLSIVDNEGTVTTLDTYKILLESDTADSVVLATNSGSSMIFTGSTMYDDLINALTTSINSQIDANTLLGEVCVDFDSIFSHTTNDSIYIAMYNSYPEPIVVKYITDFLPASSQTNYVIPQGFTLADGTIFKKGETISYVYSMEDE